MKGILKAWKWVLFSIIFTLFLLIFIQWVRAIHELPLQMLTTWSPIGFILLQFLQVLIAPIPGHALGVAGGALFGTFWGGVYTLIAQTVGGILLFFLTRRYGLPFLKRFFKVGAIHESPLHRVEFLFQDSKIGKWWVRRFNHSSLNQSSNFKFVSALFLMYLLPGFPDDILAILAGLTQIRIFTFLLAILLGRAPGVFLLSAIGEGTTQLPNFLRWLTL